MNAFISRLQLPPSRPRRIALVGIALLLVAAGINHFVNPGLYLPMMPSYLPAHLPLVYVSGALEVIGGLWVLAPQRRPLAGWFLVALLIGVFPANLHMALHPESFSEIPAWGLWVRLPLQGVLMLWAWWATRVTIEE